MYFFYMTLTSQFIEDAINWAWEAKPSGSHGLTASSCSGRVSSSCSTSGTRRVNSGSHGLARASSCGSLLCLIVFYLYYEKNV